MSIQRGDARRWVAGGRAGVLLGMISGWVLPLLGQTCLAQSLESRRRTFTMKLEGGYERTALNYQLLLADTTALSPDSLEQLEKSSDTRSEMYTGVSGTLGSRAFRIANGLYYGQLGWQDRFAAQAQVRVNRTFETRAASRIEFRQNRDTPDSLAFDYWTMTNDLRLLAAVTDRHTTFVRVDWERLSYTRGRPLFAYDFDRLRARAGWRWESADLDLAELAIGAGNRFVPDSAEREYAEMFVAGLLDLNPGLDSRLSLDVFLDEKDYRSADPGDDYTLASVDARWESRSVRAVTLRASARWDFWDFKAQDEVSFDFHELEPAVELQVPLGEEWALRAGPRLRLVRAAKAAFSANDYTQPSGVIGIEYAPLRAAWAEARLEAGYRDYREEAGGYTDFTDVKLSGAAEIDLNSRFHCSVAIDYEREFHRSDSDDTDFVFFSIALRYLVR